MDPRERIFRRAALERLSSPEQLDHAIRATTLRGWLALAAVLLVVAGVITWSLLGEVATRVRGEGILMRSGGVFAVVALGSGQITVMQVAVGDRVDKGQVVATVAQPTLLDELEKAKAKLAEMRLQEIERRAMGIQGERSESRSLEQERKALARAIRAARERYAWLKERAAADESLFSRGMTSRETVLATRRDLQRTKEEIDRAETDQTQASLRELEYKAKRKEEVSAGRLRLSDQERAIALLQERIELSSNITSPHSGRVIEVRTAAGGLVAPGTPILNLEVAHTATASPRLEALIYLSPADGKRVRPGMEVQLAPPTVKREEFGLLKGRVRAVADFPYTRQGMMRILENEALVQRFMDAAGGAPIAVEIDLIADAAAPSGYEWSSGRGPPATIDAGTIAGSEITVHTQRPISLVLPLLQRATMGPS